MKRLSRLTLRQWAWLIALLVFALISLEALWLYHVHQQVLNVHRQIDVVRQQQFHFNEVLSAELPESARQARVKQISKTLSLLETGGLLPLTLQEVTALQGIPAVTLKSLLSDWKAFTESTDSVTRRTYALLIDGHFEVLIRDLHRQEAKEQTIFTYSLAGNLIIIAAVLYVLVRSFRRKILEPLHQLAINAIQHNHTNGLPDNELGKVAININTVIENLRDASDFVTAIGEGNLTKDYRELEPDYEPGKNKLADSLIAMQEKLRQINEEEQKRKWANEGLARFVDILRSSQNNLHQLGDRIIATLVQYTGSNQGGLYVLNEDDPHHPHLELLSLYAFNIKKHQQQKVKPGEGLLGQTFLEQQTVYLKELPDEYIRITSGLGDASPRNLLIVPLKLEDKVYGMVELASFREYQPHEIAFVEKLGETIASTLATVRNNQRTQRLLDESRMAAESLRAQEEEMRQNMEELTATQEEMQRILRESQQKETYLNNLMDASGDAFVAIDRNYCVALRNNAPLFEQFIKAGIPYEKGFNVLSLFKADEVEYHKAIYDRVFQGESISVVKNYFGRDYSVNYKPLRAPNGEILGAAIYAHDLTHQQLQEKRISELEQQLARQTTDEVLTGLEKALRLNLEALEITRRAAGGQ
ncbi:MAG: GAF domain-containing protein [Cyclobacteriaceae bacterium]|nr:GAF domain-containing protein [Cyclobacteriaceae bacterium]